MTDADTNRPTILVVDDSRLMRVAARKILKEDFEILEAEDGEIAWDRLQETPAVTLVMSDLSMPNLDGLGLLAKIRESSHAHLKDLPVIIVTGAEDDDGSKKTALAAGASDFITKPFDSVQLLARAKTQARQQRTQQALQDSEASNQQLEQQSHVDPLTGLSNGRAFTGRIEEDLSYAIRHRTELALLLIRVDKYKVLFLRHGKPAAEEALRRIAGILLDGRRREDTVARINMDTFGVLLPSANLPGANRVAQQLRTAIEQGDFCIDGNPVPVNVSIGVSSGMINSATRADALLNEASQALDTGSSPAAAAPQQPHVDASAGRLPATPFEPAEQTAEATAPAAQLSPEAHPAPPEAAQSGEPMHTPMPTAEPPQAAQASDVARALQALSEGVRPAADADALVQAVVPLLEAWNNAHNGRHTAIIEQVRSALRRADSTAAVSRTVTDPAPETA